MLGEREARDLEVRAHRHARHDLDAAADGDIDDAGRDEVRGEVDRLLRRAALAVDGRAGHFDREAGFEHHVAADVRGLLADLRDVAEDDVADQRRVEPDAIDDLAQHLRAERDGVRARKHAVAAAHGGPNGFYDDYFCRQDDLLLVNE